MKTSNAFCSKYYELLRQVRSPSSFLLPWKFIYPYNVETVSALKQFFNYYILLFSI